MECSYYWIISKASLFYYLWLLNGQVYNPRAVLVESTSSKIFYLKNKLLLLTRFSNRI